MLVALVLAICTCFQIATAQFYFGPNVGFRSYGLKGAYKLTQQGGAKQVGNVVDAGKTGFNFALSTGYQVFPSTFAGGWYKLDIGIDATYSSVPFFETGYNAQVGAGKFAANGLSGGSTSIISIDILPLHRMNFPKFRLLSPYAGLGLGLNLMSTKDISVSPPSGTGTVTGEGEMKLGLLIAYGVVIRPTRPTDMIQPFIQFKHLIPFGSETVLTQSFNLGGQGSGTY